MTGPIEWTWRGSRDRAQVGAFFGGVGGVVALLISLLMGLILRWSGRAVSLGEVARLHAWLIILYVVIGFLIGLFWPRRVSTLGRWGLWFLAALPISVTILAFARGAPGDWDQRSWLHLAIMIPAFAWLFSDAPKRPRSKEPS